MNYLKTNKYDVDFTHNSAFVFHGGAYISPVGGWSFSRHSVLLPPLFSRL
jgi:hypothetical protein